MPIKREDLRPVHKVSIAIPDALLEGLEVVYVENGEQTANTMLCISQIMNHFDLKDNDMQCVVEWFSVKYTKKIQAFGVM